MSSSLLLRVACGVLFQLGSSRYHVKGHVHLQFSGRGKYMGRAEGME